MRAQQTAGPWTSGPLVDRAGFYPDVKWTDPNEKDTGESGDEESGRGVGWDRVGVDVDDSQAKWKWRRRTRRMPRGRVRKVLDEFGLSLIVVGLPGAVWYFYLVGNG